MSETLVKYESAGGIAVITVDRPAKRNALSVELCRQLHEAWQRFDGSESDRAAILTATGDEVFTAGADLKDPPPKFWQAVPGVGVPLEKPVIAAVAGLVIGAGVAITVMCDLCVAAANTRFVYPEAKVGIAAGMITAIAGRVPHKIALELMMLGEPVTAERAYQVGFVNRVVPVGQQLAVARQMAQTLAESAPLVLRMFKRMVNETLPHSPVETMYAAQRSIEQIMQSEDAKEGLLAFREKRRPGFKGR
jgi:enoyl-CoA hydratase/carnithine racemase